jgi:hypothetical protein
MLVNATANHTMTISRVVREIAESKKNKEGNK